MYIINGAVDGHQKYYGAKPYVGFTRFNPANCEWTEMSAVPKYKRDHFVAGIVGSKIVLAAGSYLPRSRPASLLLSW